MAHQPHEKCDVIFHYVPIAWVSVQVLVQSFYSCDMPFIFKTAMPNLHVFFFTWHVCHSGMPFIFKTAMPNLHVFSLYMACMRLWHAIHFQDNHAKPACFFLYMACMHVHYMEFFFALACGLQLFCCHFVAMQRAHGDSQHTWVTWTYMSCMIFADWASSSPKQLHVYWKLGLSLICCYLFFIYHGHIRRQCPFRSIHAAMEGIWRFLPWWSPTWSLLTMWCCWVYRWILDMVLEVKWKKPEDRKSVV